MDLPEDEEILSAQGSFFTRFAWAFTSPSRVHYDISADVPWWQPWIWLSILSGIGVWLFYPIQETLIRLNPKGIPEESLEKSIEMMQKFQAIGYLTGAITVLVQSLIMALISYVIVSIFTSQGSFKRLFTLYLYSYIIPSVGAILSFVLARQKGLENIRSMQDARVSLGLSFLVSSEHRYLEAFLNTIDVFSIWFYILMVLGIMTIFRLTRKQAILSIVPIWLISVAFELAGAKFGKMF